VQFGVAVHDFVFHVAITPWPAQADQPVTFTFKNGPRLDIIHCFLDRHGELPLTPVFTSRRSCLHQARTMLPAGPVRLFFEIDWRDPGIPECDRGLGPWEFEVQTDGAIMVPDVTLAESAKPDSGGASPGAAPGEEGIPF
jgi:hypothetical protein